MLSLTDLYHKFLACTGVSTDTRQITPDCLFVALKGPSFDGNQFVADAFAKGARYALVDNADVAAAHPDRCLLTTDSLTTLQDLARHHRRTLTIPVVGLTGSNGKTTTKELIAAVLSRRYVTYATRGNFNNHIGVPLTLLALNDTHEMAVVEMGANHQREIALLSAIAEPSHGLITNIGKAHLEGFGGLEGVRIGKGELYDFLAQTGGTVFVNGGDATLRAMHGERSGFGETVVYPDQLPPDFAPTLVAETPVVTYRTGTGQNVTTHLPGRYNFDNMAAALAIGHHFGVTAEEAHRAIADYNPTNNRSQVVSKGTNTVLLDAYNANPSSMAAAVQQFMALPAPRKVVILGDMYELGDDSPAEHAALGELVARGNFDVVILAGVDMKYALGALPQAYYFPDKFSLHNWLMDHPMEHTHVLVKGSRGMGLESVVPFI